MHSRKIWKNMKKYKTSHIKTMNLKYQLENGMINLN